MSVFDHWRTHATNGDRSASPSNGHSSADDPVESEQLYRRLVDAAGANPDAFMIMRPVRDAGGSIVDFAIEFQNQAARAMHRSHGGVEEPASLSAIVGNAGGNLATALEPYVAAFRSGLQREDEVATSALGHDRWYVRRLDPVGDAMVVTYRETTDQVLEVEALARAGADKQAILDGLADLVLVSDLANDGQYRISYANEPYYAFFGLTPEQVIGKTGDELYGGELRDIIRSASVAATDRPVTVELSGPVQGQARHVQVRITPVLDASGRLVRRIWRGTDLTEQHRVQGTLERSQSHYEAILNGLSDLICVSEPAEDGEFRITYANPAYLQFMGVDAEDITNRPRDRFQRADLYDLYDSIRREAIALGGPLSRDLSAEINGRMRHAHVLVTPEFDAQGNCTRAIWRITDLTGQRESEAELDRAEALEQAILDGLSDFVYVLDRDEHGEFRFKHANRAAYDAGEPRDLLGKRIEDILEPEQASSRMELLLRCVRQREPVSGEFTANVGGRQMIVDVRATPVMDEHHEVHRVIWRATDLTERRASENLFRAAATANLDPFNHLEPVYGPHGEVADYVFRYGNAAGLEFRRRFSGCDAVDRLSQLFERVPRALQGEMDLYLQAMRGGQALEDEIRAVDAQGNVRWIYRQIIPVEGGVLVSGRDITERKLQTQVMERSERIQRMVLEGLNDAIVLYEQDDEGRWRVLYANRAFLDYRGLDAEQVVGKTTWDFLPREVAERNEELRAAALEAGGPIEREVTTTVNGVEQRRIIRVTPVLDEEGRCIRVIWRYTDVTEAYEHQRTIEAAERNQRAILDALHDGILVFERQGIGEDFRVTYSRPIESLRDSYTDIVGSTFEAIWQGERLAERRDVVERAIAGRRPVDFETTIVTSSGAVIHELARVTPVFDHQDICNRLVWRFTDVTEAYEQRRAVEEAERNQRAILDALSDVLIVMDRDPGQQFRVTYINAAREALTGRPDAQLLGKAAPEFLPETEAAQLERTFEYAISRRRTVDFEGTTPDRNDEPLFYSARITPVFEEDGTGSRVILRYTDVTAEHLARELLEESERNREAIVENLADIVLLFDRDDAGDFRLSYANPPFFETGRTPEETLHQRFEDFLDPSEAAVRKAMFSHALELGGPVERELTVQVRDRLFHYTSRVTPLFDHTGGGQCHRTIWRYTDITELVKNREQLAESERNQRAIIEGLSDALLVLDRHDGRTWQVAQANAAYFAMVGVTAGESLGRTLADLAGSSDDARETLAAVQEALVAGAPVDSETERVTGAGSSVIARRVTPLFDGNGRCHRMLVRTTDLTERRLRDVMLNRLGRIIDDATDEVYLVDTDFGLLQTNAGARRNLGYTEEELRNLSVTQVIVGETEESLRGWMAPLLDGSQSRVTIEARLRRKDGSTYPVEAELQYMAGESPPVVLAIARDVTERQSLQATLARMAAIVESSADAVIGVDNDGRIEHWNLAAHRLFGHARQEVLGRALSDVFGGGRWPAGRLEALARGGGAVDTSLPRRDGDELDVALSVFPVHDPTGRALGTAMIAHDIRWRLDATRALRESESRFRTIVDQAPSGILIQRAADGVILDVNQYLLDLVGYRRDEIVGNRPIELGLVEDPSIVVALDSQLATGTRTAPRELGVLTRSGETKEMLVSVESIDLNGERCYLSFLGDISRLRTAERDLLRAQEGLRSITQNLPVILTSWDEKGRCTLATGHGLELAGTDGDALLGLHISEIIGPSQQLETARAAAEPGQTGAIEFSLAGRIFESQYRVLPDGSGTVAVAVDVTEQRATLRQIETIVENAPITLVVVDAAGLITIARGRSGGLSFSLQEGVGRSIFDVLPSQSPAHADLRRALAGERFSATYQSPATTSVDVHYTPVRSADGALTGVVAVIIDVTERMQAQLAIQESNERFREIAETASDGIVSVSTEGRIVFANQALATIFGYDREALIGQPLTILMPHELVSAHRQGFRRYLDTGEKRLSWNGLELTGRRRDGTHFQAEMSFSEGSHDGERVVTAFIRDITERRRTEEALLQAQKLESLGILAGGIAHDFNNMLVAIMGNAGLAMADLSPESPVYETVQEIELAARRAAELARQMLAYSGKGRLAVSRVDLSALVIEIPHLLRSSIGVGVSLSHDLASDLPPVEADVTQLRQVIMNLVINASDAIGDHEGVIAVSTGVVEADSAYLSSTFLPGELEPGQYCYLEVADTGCGMSPDTLARIFDPFFTTKFTGKGLGLAAVLGIVRGHRGTIKVQSTPGQGTTFCMLLPVAQGALPSTVVRPPSDEPWKGEGLVLVVDDEESVRNVTCRALRSMGLETVVAVDGQDGLERFEALHQQLACVLMDLTMPRLNGEAAAARMRAIDPSVPIVLMSGFDEGETATRFRWAGIAGFVQKPFEVRSLRGAIRLAMDRTD